MSLPPSAGGASFGDFFGPDFFRSPLQMPDHGTAIPFYQMDRILAVPETERNCIVVIMRDSSSQPQTMNAGCAMTVREAAQFITILRRALAVVEQGPQGEFPPPSNPTQQDGGGGGLPPWIDEDEPYV